MDLEEIRMIYKELKENPYPEKNETSEFDDPTFRVNHLIIFCETLFRKEQK